MTDLLPYLPALLISGLYYLSERRHEREARAWENERSKLLTRIQDPAVAKAIDAPEPGGEPLYIPFDDDKAWAEYQEARAMGELE